MNNKIPDKLYFKIGEVSKLADVAPHVLRYWESEFSGIRPKRASSKQRLYRREDVKRILVIKNLLHVQGYTISGARKLIGDTANLNNLVVEEEQEIERPSQLNEIKEELLQLKNMLSKKSNK